MTEVAPGVYKLTFGTPEAHTPMRYKEMPPAPALAGLAAGPLPFGAEAIRFHATARGCTLELPMGGAEQFFGMGLQLKSHNQTQLKKIARMNSDPVADTGDSHAPMPFYVSTAGYAVLVDTLRYASFYFGSHVRVGEGRTKEDAWRVQQPWNRQDVYDQREGVTRRVLVDIPVAQGADVYIFTGPALADAVRRYVLFSGGGVLPPLWGLGVWYRVYGKFNQQQTLELAERLREQQIPCDVLGLEPGWHAHSYACTYTWDAKFPQPDALIAQTAAMGYRLNLWEHAFTHQASPLYDALKPYAGSHEVWDGIVPDFTCPPAREAFAAYQGSQFIDRGIAGFKLDECDNSDFVAYAWSFPEAAQFPSGLDGEQYHSLFGVHYQRTMFDAFTARDRRTLGQVRASGPLAAPYPFVLYSDLYDHADFIRGVVNAGFHGLLWSPEVREGKTIEGLVRRLQSVVLSPHALVNAWYIPLPPWEQVDKRKNVAGERMAEAAEATALVRSLFELRMRLLPYLYAAFARYALEGHPPFRALVMDYPQDEATWHLDDQYMMGDDLLVAPVLVNAQGTGPRERPVYLPDHPGGWYSFHTGEHYVGGMRHTVAAPLERIPLFVKAGTILPLARPVQHVADDTVFDLDVYLWGEGLRPAVLFEDDATTYAYQGGQSNLVTLTPDRQMQRAGNYAGRRYNVVAWHARPAAATR